jgi:hypothetical protein
VSVIGLVAEGCGGSGKADPLKRPQFVRQADAICRNAEKERGKARKEAGDQSATDFITGAALPPIQTMTEELDELGPPPGEGKEVRAIISAFEGGIKKVEADPTDISAAVSAFDPANKLAEEYGLFECII